MNKVNTDISYEEIQGLDEKYDLNEIYDLLLLKDSLLDFQKDDVSSIISTSKKGSIQTHEMGLGKSYITAMIAILTKILKPEKKILIIAPTDSIGKLTNILEENSVYSIFKTNGEAKRINELIKSFKNIDILVAQFSAIERSLDFHLLLYNNIDLFEAVIVDEAGVKSAFGYKAFTDFTRQTNKTYLMHATLLGEKPEVIYNALYSISAINGLLNQFERKYTKYSNGERVANSLKIITDFSDYFVNKNREDLGIDIKINPYFHRMRTTKYQENLIVIAGENRKALSSPTTLRGSIPNQVKLLFTKKNIPSLRRLFEIINSYDKTENLVIYLNFKEAMNRIKDELEYLGRQVITISGDDSIEEKQQKEFEFNNTQGAICITTRQKAISLNSANVVILYEVYGDIAQTIYRVIRGDKSKEIDAHIIYYPKYHLESLEKKYRSINSNNIALERTQGIDKRLRAEIMDVREKYMQYCSTED